MREMKESGIEWAPKVPSHWKIMRNKYVMKKIKDICPAYNGEDILSLTMNGVIVRDLDAGGKMPASFNGYQRLYPNNLLMCLFDYDVTPRCIGLIKNEGLSSPAYSQFVMKNGNRSEYYYYYYLMIDFTKELLHLAKNLRHSFTEDQLGAINAPVPPIAEQIAIAKYLDAKCTEIDALSADIQSEIDTLQAYKRSVITEAVTKGLDKNAPMNDSGTGWMGNTPNHWHRTRVKYCLFEKNIRSETGTEEPLSMSQKLGIVPTSEIDVPHIMASYVGAKITAPNDLVLNKLKAHLGVFSVSRYRGLVSPDYAVYGAYGNTNPKYLEYLFKTEMCINEFKKYITGVGQGLSRLYTDDLFRIVISIPEKKEQDDIVEYLNSVCTEVEMICMKKQEQISILADYKKSVIYEYVTGKKEVPAV